MTATLLAKICAKLIFLLMHYALTPVWTVRSTIHVRRQVPARFQSMIDTFAEWSRENNQKPVWRSVMQTCRRLRCAQVHVEHKIWIFSAANWKSCYGLRQNCHKIDFHTPLTIDFVVIGRECSISNSWSFNGHIADRSEAGQSCHLTFRYDLLPFYSHRAY